MAHADHHDHADDHADDHDDHHEPPPPEEPQTPWWFTMLGAVLFLSFGIIFLVMNADPVAAKAEAKKEGGEPARVEPAQRPAPPAQPAQPPPGAQARPVLSAMPALRRIVDDGKKLAPVRAQKSPMLK